MSSPPFDVHKGCAITPCLLFTERGKDFANGKRLTETHFSDQSKFNS